MVRWAFLALLALFALILVLQRISIFQEDKEVRVVGRVEESLVKNSDEKFFVIADIRIKFESQAVPIPGELWEVVGRLEKRVIKPGYEYLVLIPSHLKKLGEPDLYRIYARAIRYKIVSNLLKWLPSDQGGISAGVVFGGDEHIGRKTVDEFKRVGLTHILAASGFNVGLVASWSIVLTGRWFGRRKGAWISAGVIWTYVVMAGMMPAVARAGVMGMLLVFGGLIGRPVNGLWSLAIVGLGMIIWDPMIIFDVGFQLSMVSMAGLLMVSTESHNVFVASFKQSVAAIAMTTPLIAHYFGTFSLAALPINILVLWAIPILTQIVIVASLIGFVWFELGWVISFLARPILEYLLMVVGVVSDWQFASVWVGKWDGFSVLGYYLGLFVLFKLFLK